MKPILGVTMPRDLPLDTLFHAAFAVPDLEAAMRELGESLGLTWAPIRDMTMKLQAADGSEAVWPLRAVYSRQGPAYWELVWGPAGTRFSAAEGPRFHHAGLFVEDVGAQVNRLEGLGWTTTGKALNDDGRPGVAYVTNGFIHLELLPTPSKLTIQNWLFPDAG